MALCGHVATQPGCGDTLKAVSTTPLRRLRGGTRLMAVPNGNNLTVTGQSAGEHTPARQRCLLLVVGDAVSTTAKVWAFTGLRYSLFPFERKLLRNPQGTSRRSAKDSGVGNDHRETLGIYKVMLLYVLGCTRTTLTQPTSF